VTAQQYTIKPGGTYVVNVTVRKPAFLRLEENSWEIRAYFFEGLNCYNTGSWQQLDNARIYDGWYKHRFEGNDWTDASEEKSINITVSIVDYPRPSEDQMDEIPVGGIVKFRIRSIIYLDGEPVFDVPEEAGAGWIYFTIGGTSFQYPYVKELDHYLIRSEVFQGRIDQSAIGEWRLILDKDLIASVSENAPETEIFTIPDPIELNLSPAPMLELVSTYLVISPPRFTLYPGYSGQVQHLTATLRDEVGNPLANKIITWSTTHGSINPASGTTNQLGQVSVTYTAPSVTAETPQVMITAFFAGDNLYDSSTENSYGIPAVVSEVVLASTGETIVVNIPETNLTTNVLMVPQNALSENTIITIIRKPRESPMGYVMASEIFEIGPSGTTFTEPSTLTLPYDENKLPGGVSEDDLAIYRRVGDDWEYLGGIVDTSANTISTEIDYLSEYTVMAQLQVSLPYTVLAIMVVFTGSLVAVLWKYFRK
jgi:hypothetical protein